MSSAAATADDVREEVGEAVDAIADYSYEQKEELEVFAERKLDQLDRQLADLREEMRDGSGEVREQWQSLDSSLEEQLEDTRRWLDDAQSATSEAWADAKASLGDAMASLERSIEDAREELSSAADDDSRET